MNAELRYSQDGYIRLTFQRFCSLQFLRRRTFVDEMLRDELLAMEIPAASAGYCEWFDNETPVQISIGWAWFVYASDTLLRLAPGGISCNVMMVSADGADLGPARTNELLMRWLSTCSWQDHQSLPRSGASTVFSTTIH